MPARQPFTALCQTIGRPPSSGRADLHIHTTYSDGTYTPAQVIDLARRTGLAALALTDHDTLAGVTFAQAAAIGTDIEVIPGVEITSEFLGRELHLLGYFVHLDDAPLNAALARMQARRVSRFWDMVERLRGLGMSFEDNELQAQANNSTLCRRHLATLLIESGRAGSMRDAFTRYLGDNGRVALPKLRLPVGEAIALVRGAGGIASWAHPSYDCTRENLLALRGLGLGAIEANYPTFRPGRVRGLRTLAADLGLAITGGSDCHGPGHPSRAVGACSLTAPEWKHVLAVSR